MTTPGMTVHPLPLMNGWADPNEVFLDNVVVPAENLVHGEGQGWTMAKHLLGHERPNTGRIGICKRLLAQLKGARRRQPRWPRRPPDRLPALRRPAGACGDRVDGAGDHQPALPRCAARRAAARRRGVDAQDPQHRVPAEPARAGARTGSLAVDKALRCPPREPLPTCPQPATTTIKEDSKENQKTARKKIEGLSNTCPQVCAMRRAAP